MCPRPLRGGYTSTRSPRSHTPEHGVLEGATGGRTFSTSSPASLTSTFMECVPSCLGRNTGNQVFFFIFLWLSQGPSWSTDALPGVFSPLLHGCAICAPIATPVGLRHLLVLPLVISSRNHRQHNQFNNSGCLARCLSILPAACSTCTSAG